MTLRRSYQESSNRHEDNDWSQREQQHLEKYYPTRRNSHQMAPNHDHYARHYQSGRETNLTELKEDPTFDRIVLERSKDGDEAA